jgi:hypothetical protein
LNDPKYRLKYKDFLKTDFPRVPYPHSKEDFWRLVDSGEKLRDLHLMKVDYAADSWTGYPEQGTNKVEYVARNDNKVFINEAQYFDNVLEEVWEMYIGAYQPAQKYLKDRKGTILSIDEIRHYQKIVLSLSKTVEVVNEI